MVPSEAPLVRSRTYFQPPSPSGPLLPEVGVWGGREKENFSQDELRGGRQVPTSCQSPPALIWLHPLHWTLGGAAGAGSSWSQLCPPSGSCKRLSWVGAGCARRAWHASLYCSGALAWRNPSAHMRTDQFLSASSTHVGVLGHRSHSCVLCFHTGSEPGT